MPPRRRAETRLHAGGADLGEVPAYLIPAAGRAHEVRPLLILTNGYDATITDLYFSAALQRPVAAITVCCSTRRAREPARP
jgi:hypothetical protein